VANLSTRNFSGTPYCRLKLTRGEASIRPEMVEPSLAMVMKISPGVAVVVHADRDVAFVAADRELVRDGLPLVGQLAPHRAVDHLLGDRASGAFSGAAAFFSPLPGPELSGCTRLELSR
jgi:hypothetical protein